MCFFADDTTLFVIDDDLEEATLTLNGDLYAIKVWAEQWLISFNPQKTKTMCITNKTDLLLPTVYYKGCPVESVNTHKHWGLPSPIISHGILMWMRFLQSYFIG